MGGWTALILSAAWLAHVGPAAAMPTVQEPSDVALAVPENAGTPPDASDGPSEVALEALGPEWIAISLGDDSTLRRVLRRHIEESRVAFGEAALHGDCDDRRPVASAASAAPRDRAAPQPSVPAAVACAHQAADAADAQRDGRDMEAESFGIDLPDFRDILLESEALGSLAGPLLELAREYRMQQALSRNAEQYFAELRSDSIALEPLSHAAVRGIYARPDSEILTIRAVTEFLKSPLGVLILCLAGTLAVVRMTVRVAVLLQRR